MEPEIINNSFRQSGLHPLDSRVQIPDGHNDNYPAMLPCSPVLVTMATSEVVAVVEIDSTISETVTSSLSEQV